MHAKIFITVHIYTYKHTHITIHIDTYKHTHTNTIYTYIYILPEIG